MGRQTQLGTQRVTVSSSTTPNPRTVKEEIDYKIHKFSPDSAPMISLIAGMRKGKPPINVKCEVAQEVEFDHWDYISSATQGTDVTGSSKSYGRITIDQVSRALGTGMFYRSQDVLSIAETGQTVEIIMTEQDALDNGSGEITLLDTFAQGSGSGAFVSRTLPGTLVVRTVNRTPFRAFSNSDCVFLDRTIYEGQTIDPPSRRSDVVFDYNLVEHKEAGITFTKQQIEMYKSKLAEADFDRNQRQTIERFKKSIEYMAYFGNKGWRDQNNRSKPFMGGFVEAIKTNIGYYQPSSVVNFEDLVLNFLSDQGFRYNSSGRHKVGFCGYQFLKNFSLTFRDFRRTTSLLVKEATGLNIDTYELPGGDKIMLKRTEAFKNESMYTNWFMVIDPEQSEYRVSKDFVTGDYTLNNERLVKTFIEWQGTILFPNEQNHAILKAY